MSVESRASEASMAFGVAVLAVAVAVWAFQFTLGVFNGWGWALIVGSAWTILGLLLLFSDVRVYVGAQSPAERYHAAGTEYNVPSDD
ncbi:hypothetical protein [Halorubrum ezzemoulense]|uniref:hypothetical protein n=1 Tax=Halorubrum ezzemoulense TaxID=337243 RepID=UPI00232DE616|nr:hypothetical protein [Halorubrum ezzemoulense]MDB9252874.1 hypothetical protein [Halorubrum ezzemoulense]MDB9256742.1 hypothetical protein [Halorubrum ezzemoulense]MDB9277050.1 hypothetical protein [Halorubrum ezzemoulense]